MWILWRCCSIDLESCLSHPTLPPYQKNTINVIIVTLLQPGSNADYVLNIGTRMYVDKNINVKQKFSSILEDTFLTEIKKMDKDKPMEAVLDANLWVKEVTRGNINQLLTDGKFSTKPWTHYSKRFHSYM